MLDRQIPMVDVAMNLDVLNADLRGYGAFILSDIKEAQNGDRMMPLHS